MNIDTAFNIFGFTSLVASVCLVIILIIKLDKIKQLESSLKKLTRAFDELDEQAKLILRTDLELNKTQEELDKRVVGLYTLQKISHLISTTLDEEEIFNRIKKALIIELGFDRGLILLFDKDKNFFWKMNLGFSQQELDQFKNTITNDKLFSRAIENSRLVSSINLSESNRNKASEIFGSASFVICPILTQDGIIGIIFLGNKSQATTLTQGDEELISIFATQLGQSIQNARLFEQVYKSHQNLEVTVKNRTKELADALEKVQKISKMKSDFVSAVSHELRTPLTSVKGYASILMSGKMGQIPESVKERLGKINKHSDNLVKLINDLLDISRIESGKVTMKISTINLNNLVENITDLLMPQIKEKQIELSAQLSNKLPAVLADSSQIERVFINLLSNAVKFTPIKGKISIAVRENKDYIEISVSDSGIGITQEDIGHVFEEFYRIDNTVNEKVKGTGLGLPLVKQIVEAHKGKIWVTSKLNEGSSFSFTLPIQKEA